MKKLESNKYVNISHLILKTDLFGFNYKKVINELAIKGIIEKKISGKKFKHNITAYRLAERYRNSKFKWVEIKDLKLKRKLKVFQQTNEAKLDYLIPSLSRLNIDATGCYDYLNSKYDPIANRYKARVHAIHNLINDPTAITDDNKPKRVYNRLGMLPKDLRQFVTIHNEKLWQLDISSSQLFHFIPLLDDFLRSDFVNTDIYGNETDTTDIEHFRSLVIGNQFYTYVMQGINYKGTKNDFKHKKFFKFWYGSKPSNNRMTRFLMSEFPTITKAIQFYKNNLTGYYSGSQNYKNFPIALQIAERENVVDVISKELYNENPEMTIIPNQDAIYTTEQSKEIVYNKMISTFTNKYAISPNITIEQL